MWQFDCRNAKNADYKLPLLPSLLVVLPTNASDYQAQRLRRSVEKFLADPKCLWYQQKEGKCDSIDDNNESQISEKTEKLTASDNNAFTISTHHHQNSNSDRESPWMLCHASESSRLQSIQLLLPSGCANQIFRCNSRSKVLFLRLLPTKINSKFVDTIYSSSYNSNLCDCIFSVLHFVSAESSAYSVVDSVTISLVVNNYNTNNTTNNNDNKISNMNSSDIVNTNSTVTTNNDTIVSSIITNTDVSSNTKAIISNTNQSEEEKGEIQCLQDRGVSSNESLLVHDCFLTATHLRHLSHRFFSRHKTTSSSTDNSATITYNYTGSGDAHANNADNIGNVISKKASNANDSLHDNVHANTQPGIIVVSVSCVATHFSTNPKHMASIATHTLTHISSLLALRKYISNNIRNDGRFNSTNNDNKNNSLTNWKLMLVIRDAHLISSLVTLRDALKINLNTMKKRDIYADNSDNHANSISCNSTNNIEILYMLGDPALHTKNRKKNINNHVINNSNNNNKDDDAETPLLLNASSLLFRNNSIGNSSTSSEMSRLCSEISLFIYNNSTNNSGRTNNNCSNDSINNNNYSNNNSTISSSIHLLSTQNIVAEEEVKGLPEVHRYLCRSRCWPLLLTPLLQHLTQYNTNNNENTNSIDNNLDSGSPHSPNLGSMIILGTTNSGKTRLLNHMLHVYYNNHNTNNSNITIFRPSPTDVLSSLVGGTEQNLKRVFANAKQAQPSVIVFEHFDALFNESNNNNSNSNSNNNSNSGLMASFLACLDDLRQFNRVLLQNNGNHHTRHNSTQHVGVTVFLVMRTPSNTEHFKNSNTANTYYSTNTNVHANKNNNNNNNAAPLMALLRPLQRQDRLPFTLDLDYLDHLNKNVDTSTTIENSNTANSNTANRNTANRNTANRNTANSNTANSNTANSNVNGYSRSHSRAEAEACTTPLQQKRLWRQQWLSSSTS